MGGRSSLGGKGVKPQPHEERPRRLAVRCRESTTPPLPTPSRRLCLRIRSLGYLLDSRAFWRSSPRASPYEGGCRRRSKSLGCRSLSRLGRRAFPAAPHLPNVSSIVGRRFPA